MDFKNNADIQKRDKANPEIANEEWRHVTISGFGRYYQISSAGRVKSLGRFADGFQIRFLNERILNGKIRNDGYRVVRLRYAGSVREYAIHRLVALAFCSNPRNHTEVNHKDGNKLNNHTSNLEWVSHKENIQHSILTGLNKSQGADNKQFKGLIVATNLATNETQTFCGKKALIDSGFEHSCVYAVIAGRARSHRGYHFARLPLNQQEAA